MAARDSTGVIGIRLPEKVAMEFKTEAAARKVRLNELFREMWEHYRKAAIQEARTSDGN